MKINPTLQNLLDEIQDIEGSDILEPVPVIPTGIGSVDMATRIGGVPRGYVTEVSGGFDAGKSVLTWHVIRTCCASGGSVIYADADRALSPKYMAAVGVPVEDIAIAHPKGIADVLKIVKIAVANEVDLVVVDSLAALPEASHLDTEYLFQISLAASMSNTAVIITNQYRYFGSRGLVPMYEDALRNMAPLALDMQMRGSIERFGEIIGHKVDICVVRNRFAYVWGHHKGEGAICCNLIYGSGIDLVDAKLTAMLQSGEIQTTSPGRYMFEGVSYHGKEQLRMAIAESMGGIEVQEYDGTPTQP